MERRAHPRLLLYINPDLYHPYIYSLSTIASIARHRTMNVHAKAPRVENATKSGSTVCRANFMDGVREGNALLQPTGSCAKAVRRPARDRLD